MEEEVYSITDIHGYVSQIREIAAQSISENSSNDDLDNYINLNQVIDLVKVNCLGFDEENRPLLNEEANQKIFEQTAIWIHNVGLSKLAGMDLIECAWDSELDEMVFWNKENIKPKNKKKKK